MLTAVLTHQQSTCLPNAVFPALDRCMTIVRVAAAMKRMWETNINLNQYQAPPKNMLLTKLSNCCFTDKYWHVL